MTCEAGIAENRSPTNHSTHLGSQKSHGFNMELAQACHVAFFASFVLGYGQGLKN